MRRGGGPKQYKSKQALKHLGSKPIPNNEKNVKSSPPLTLIMGILGQVVYKICNNLG